MIDYDDDFDKIFEDDAEDNKLWAKVMILNLEGKGIINGSHQVNIKLKDEFVCFSYQPPFGYPMGSQMRALIYRLPKDRFQGKFKALWFTFQKIIPKDLKDGLDKNRP